METSPSEIAEGEAIVQVLAAVLERLVSANSHLSSSSTHQEQTHFHAQRAPAIGMLQYLERIHKYASCSKECFIIALIYIDRLIQRNNFLLTTLNVHRVVITSILLAAKFFDDAYYNNAYYAKVGGVLVEEMNNLETQFLFKIDFSLRVLPEVFEKYEAELVSHANDIGLQRIACSTDAELYASAAIASSQATQQQQVTAQEHQLQLMMSATSHAPSLQQQTYFVAAATPGETEFQDYSFVHPLEWPQQQQYHPKQQPTIMEKLDPVYTFPTFPHQVNAYQEQYPSAASTGRVRDDVTGSTLQCAAHQEVMLHPYTQAIGTTTAPLPRYSSHAEVKDSAPMMMSVDLGYYYPPAHNFHFAAASQHEASAYSQYPGLSLNSSNRTMIYPEITPSPPPQPPINVHGLPVYNEGEVGGPYVGLPSLRVGTERCGGVACTNDQYCSNPSDSAMALHHLPRSHPIAVGNQLQYHHQISQDISGSGWSMLSQVLEKNAGLSGST